MAWRICQGETDSADINIAIISETDALLNAVPILNASLPDGQVSKDYHAELASNVNVKDVTWAKLSRNFPPGLTLYSNGVISGIPEEEGEFPFITFIIYSDSVNLNAGGYKTLHDHDKAQS